MCAQCNRLREYKIKDIEFSINIEKLVTGFSVDTDDIDTLIELEKACKSGCNGLKNLLLMMANFGGEEVFEI